MLYGYLDTKDPPLFSSSGLIIRYYPPKQGGYDIFCRNGVVVFPEKEELPMDINEFRNLFPDEEVCRQYLERTIWLQSRICPHCKCQKSWILSGPSVRKGLYEYAECGRQFTVTTKTPLHSTKLPLRTWLMAMCFMVNSSKGVSSVFLAKWIGVRQKTAWKVGHAVRALMKLHGDAVGPLEGIVELDEKYLGGKPRFVQGVTNPRGKGTRKSCVHVAVERKGEVKADVVPGDSYAELVFRVARVVSPIS
jgi:transposase-like protein